MGNWKDYVGHEDANISIIDAGIIQKYCLDNAIQAPLMRVVSPHVADQGQAWEEGFEIENWNRLGWPINEPVCVMFDFLSSGFVYARQLQIAANLNNDAKYPGFEDYMMVLNFSRKVQLSRVEVLQKIVNDTPQHERLIFVSFKRIYFTDELTKQKVIDVLNESSEVRELVQRVATTQDVDTVAAIVLQLLKLILSRLGKLA